MRALTGLAARNTSVSPPSEPSNISVTFAWQTHILDAAFRLTHDQYVRCGYMQPHPSGRRLSLHHALPSTRVFVARAEEAVLGTLSIIEDSPLGLPMDEIYSAELGGLRAQGRRIAEVSALVMDPATRHWDPARLMRLVRLALLYAAVGAALDDVCIAVNPRHVSFYRRVLHFVTLGDLKTYEKVNGAPAVALRLDLHGARAALHAVHSGRLQPSAHDEFLYGLEAYCETMPEIRRDLKRSALTREQFVHFFGAQEALDRAPVECRRFVESLYREPRAEASPPSPGPRWQFASGLVPALSAG
jgi:hypothetical protein